MASSVRRCSMALSLWLFVVVAAAAVDDDEWLMPRRSAAAAVAGCGSIGVVAETVVVVELAGPWTAPNCRHVFAGLKNYCAHIHILNCYRIVVKKTNKALLQRSNSRGFSVSTCKSLKQK